MTENSDSENTYRVRQNQPGRKDKPVRLDDDRVAHPGQQFTARAEADLSAFADRIEAADGEDHGFTDADVFADLAADAGTEDTAPDADADDDDEPATSAAGAEEAGDDAGADGDTADAPAADADDADVVDPADLASEIGYDGLSVEEVRETVRDGDFSDRERRALLQYEKQHDDRKTAKEAIQQS